jgi:uncharacterized protein
VFDTHAATLVGLIRADTRRWQILRMVESLELPDCWIGAGFVRAAVWDHLHQRQATLSGDVDVVWFDLERADAKADHALEARLRALDPLPWSVTNQARMHVRNTDRPYRSMQDALAFWPDTATAVAVRARGDVIDIAAPHGLDDLFNLVVRPTPAFESDKLPHFHARIVAKRWLERWPKLTVIAG